MFLNDGFVNKQISDAKAYATALQTSMMNISGGTNIHQVIMQHKNARCNFNMAVIQAILGAEVSKKDKKGIQRFVFKHTPATADEVASIVNIVNELVKMEDDFFDQLNNFMSEDDEEDGGINRSLAPTIAMPVETSIDIPNINKPSGKSMGEALLTPEYLTMRLDSSDFMKIYAIGKRARKHDHVKTALIVGGIILGVVGIAVGAYFLYRHFHPKDNIEYLPESDVPELPEVTTIEAGVFHASNAITCA